MCCARCVCSGNTRTRPSYSSEKPPVSRPQTKENQSQASTSREPARVEFVGCVALFVRRVQFYGAVFAVVYDAVWLSNSFTYKVCNRSGNLMRSEVFDILYFYGYSHSPCLFEDLNLTRLYRFEGLYRTPCWLSRQPKQKA